MFFYLKPLFELRTLIPHMQYTCTYIRNAEASQIQKHFTSPALPNSNCRFYLNSVIKSMNLPFFCFVLSPGRKKEEENHARNLLPTNSWNRSLSLTSQHPQQGAAVPRAAQSTLHARGRLKLREHSASQGGLGQGNKQMYIKGSRPISQYV